MSEVRSGCAVRAAIQDDEAKKLDVEAELIKFFRSPEGDRLGRNGDIDNLTPVQTAIRAMKRIAELEEQVDLAEKLGMRICRDLSHAIDEIPKTNEMKPMLRMRLDSFQKSIGNTANYRHRLHADLTLAQMRVENYRSIMTSCQRYIDPTSGTEAWVLVQRIDDALSVPV